MGGVVEIEAQPERDVGHARDEARSPEREDESPRVGAGEAQGGDEGGGKNEYQARDEGVAAFCFEACHGRCFTRERSSAEGTAFVVFQREGESRAVLGPLPKHLILEGAGAAGGVRIVFEVKRRIDAASGPERQAVVVHKEPILEAPVGDERYLDGHEAQAALERLDGNQVGVDALFEDEELGLGNTGGALQGHPQEDVFPAPGEGTPERVVEGGAGGSPWMCPGKGCVPEGVEGAARVVRHIRALGGDRDRQRARELARVGASVPAQVFERRRGAVRQLLNGGPLQAVPRVFGTRDDALVLDDADGERTERSGEQNGGDAPRQMGFHPSTEDEKGGGR